eukprot:1159316-Pelagomonas_calceolata.AAC.4
MASPLMLLCDPADRNNPKMSLWDHGLGSHFHAGLVYFWRYTWQRLQQAEISRSCALWRIAWQGPYTVAAAGRNNPKVLLWDQRRSPLAVAELVTPGQVPLQLYTWSYPRPRFAPVLHHARLDRAYCVTLADMEECLYASPFFFQSAPIEISADGTVLYGVTGDNQFCDPARPHNISGSCGSDVIGDWGHSNEVVPTVTFAL